MQIARRLYLYFIAAASLGALAIGLTNLLELLFQRVAESLTDSTVLLAGRDEVRRQLSVHLAVIVVAVPIWLLHWWLVERPLRRALPDRESERRSELRALFFTVVLAAAGVLLVVAIRDLTLRALLELTGAERDGPRIEWPLAVLLVAGAIWLYHARMRRRDMRGGELDGAADWLPRLYLYGAATVGAVMLLLGLAELLALAVQAAVDDAHPLFDERWWSLELAHALAGIVTGFAVWSLHWGYGLRLARRADWVGDHLRRSGLRRLYLYALALFAVVVSLAMLADALETILRALLGVRQDEDESFSLQLLDPLSRLLPFAGAWLYHRLVLMREAATAEADTQAAVRRLYVYTIAAAALAVGAFGLAGTIALVVDRLQESGATLVAAGDPWREDLARLLSFTIVGTLTWLWHWTRAQRWVAEQGWVAAHPASERNALTRRVYLYVVLAASVIAVLVSLAVVLYRVIAALLDVDTAARLDADLGAPLATFLVAGAVLLYHLVTLRADLLARPDEELPGATLQLVLSGPPGADLGAVVEDLRAGLPGGYALSLESTSSGRSG